MMRKKEKAQKIKDAHPDTPTSKLDFRIVEDIAQEDAFDEAVKIAFEVGNRHFPLALEKNKILVPDDKVMVRLLERLGAAWERRKAIFDPIGNTQMHQHGTIS